MVTEEKMQDAREWVKQRASGFVHKDLNDQKELTGGNKRATDRLLKALLAENTLEKAFKIVEGRLKEYYRPFEITGEDVLRIRASRDSSAAMRLRSIESADQPPHPETLETKRRLLAIPWHATHQDSDEVHSIYECAARRA